MDPMLRLTVGSMWGFEEIGVEELEKRINTAYPDAKFHCEYFKPDEVLTVKVHDGDHTIKVAAVVSDFINEHQNKDLLDMPRIHQLDVPLSLSDEDGSPMATADKHETGSLLDLDDGSDEKCATFGNPVIKSWQSSAGGAGCFAVDFQEILGQIGDTTGTKLLVLPDPKGIEVSGRCEGGVNDALERLTRVEKPLLYYNSPLVAHVGISETGDHVRYSIQNYSTLNNVALRRVLTDSTGDANLQLGQMFVTVLYSFDKDTQEYKKPDSLVHPPNVTNEAGPSRIWNDFSFAELGDADEFLAMDTIEDKEIGSLQAFASGISLPHPYLTAEKAKQVNQWVVERAGIEPTDSDLEPEPECPVTPVTVIKRPPGIKARKAVASGQPVLIPSPPKPSLEPLAEKVQDVPDEDSPTPRRRWKMEYRPNISDSTGDSGSGNNGDHPNVPSVPKAPGWQLGPPMPNFDATKYGLNRLSRLSPVRKNGSSKAANPKDNMLLDVFTEAYDSNPQLPLVSFEQPPLVPQRLCSNELVFVDEEPCSFLEDLTDHKRRLLYLKKVLRDQTGEVGRSSQETLPISTREARRQATRQLAKEKLMELERVHRLDEQRQSDEVSSRKFHRVMYHKTAKQVKQKRQGTLEDAWGIIKTPVKKHPETSQSHSHVEKEGRSAKGTQLSQAEACIVDDVKGLHEAIEPILQVAECFPGRLTLEVQIGLILVPLLPKSYKEGLISCNEWTRIFKPRSGLVPPTTKFFNRLTSSGCDVDHLVDLKTSKQDGKRRIFEQEYTDYKVTYEFHCRTKSDQPLIITVDEQGGYTIVNTIAELGAVNLHFPGQTWDARAVTSGSFCYEAGSHPEFEEAAKYLVDHICIRSEKGLIRIFTKIPEGNNIVIEKAYMKRWTRHRYIRPTDTCQPAVNPPAANGPASSNISPNTATAVAADTGASSKTDVKDHASVATSSDSGFQDVFLQVTEVQDLFIGVGSSCKQALRARCTSLPDMLKNGRLWYEASLVSPAIEELLRQNVNIEVGEATEDWRGVDLFGRDAALFENRSSGFTGTPSPVSVAIGTAGIGDLFRIAKTVVEKTDGLGYWNVGPGIDVARVGASGSLNTPIISSGKVTNSAAEQKAVVKMSVFGQESPKEIESDNPYNQDMTLASSIPSVPLDYW
ncbi:uncharacterized protein BDW47DRAFT_126628 [Aspergillus candidus]|uniref:Uncharacterized protein n=1 Tax=Aspergillus candidus TaxID=41067 RepID=A0A2I2F959_ASPCN|nr:hypothetical protein BDW47DRAFT_126628 [Aspergillus candidus]PLB37174.1 hypothetical protein BDW47DRAFT_126628 [Aspergillus candidus]